MKTLLVLSLTLLSIGKCFATEGASYTSNIALFSVNSPGQALDKGISDNKKAARTSDPNCKIPGWALVETEPMQMALVEVNFSVLRVTQSLSCIGF